MNRDKTFKFRITEEEYIRLKVMSFSNGVKPSEALRQMINSGYQMAVALMLDRAQDDETRKKVLESITTLRKIAMKEGTEE